MHPTGKRIPRTPAVSDADYTPRAPGGEGYNPTTPDYTFARYDTLGNLMLLHASGGTMILKGFQPVLLYFNNATIADGPQFYALWPW